MEDKTSSRGVSQNLFVLKGMCERSQSFISTPNVIQTMSRQTPLYMLQRQIRIVNDIHHLKRL